MGNMQDFQNPASDSSHYGSEGWGFESLRTNATEPKSRRILPELMSRYRFVFSVVCAHSRDQVMRVRPDSYAALGMLITTRVPSPGLLSMLISPLCCSTIRLAMDNPSPLPFSPPPLALFVR